MTIDQRMPEGRLPELLADAGFTVTWPPDGYAAWRAIARRIAHREALPPQPTVYNPEVMRAIHTADAVAARAAMRAAGGWLQAPHNDDDFEATLRAWETGVCDGSSGDGEEHWVAAACAAFGSGRRRVDVARCKVCGLPVYAIGLEWRLSHDPEDTETTGWRLIWPSLTAPRSAPRQCSGRRHPRHRRPLAVAGVR